MGLPPARVRAAPDPLGPELAADGGDSPETGDLDASAFPHVLAVLGHLLSQHLIAGSCWGSVILGRGSKAGKLLCQCLLPPDGELQL